jgi:Secretion system C-terminal sorting domain
MKRLLLLPLLLSLFVVDAQTTAIPDADFEQHLINIGLDASLDGQVITANIDTLTELIFSFGTIADLTGIQDFTALTKLYVADNTLTSLDLSQNPNLTYLHCYSNLLTSIDVTQNPLLDYLNCWVNQLTSIDVSQNPLLTYLNVGSNQLISINVTQNPILDYFSVNNNQVSSLDVTQNTVLDILNCGNNQLTTLDVTQIDSLRNLQCGDNQLTSLDVTQNMILRNIDFTFNQLSSIDLSSQQSTLNDLFLAYNLFTELNLSGFPSLASLNCDHNLLTCLNIQNGNNTGLLGIWAWGNPNLTCVQVDDPTYSQANWILTQHWFDPGITYSTGCNNACSFGVGIDELTSSTISIHPNPTTGQLTIALAKGSATAVTLRNSLGQLLLSDKSLTGNQLTLDISAYSTGIYFLQLEVDGKLITKKVVKE